MIKTALLSRYFRFVTETWWRGKGEAKDTPGSAAECERGWHTCWKSWCDKTTRNGKELVFLHNS